MISDGASLFEQVAHGPHRLIDVVEEREIAVAQVVQAGLAVGVLDEAVLGAATVTGEAHIAVQALLGQGVELGLPELLLAGEATSSIIGVCAMLPSL